MFLIRNGFKQGDALSPLLFNFVFDYAIRRIHGKPGRLEIKWCILAFGLC
jgi:hypothetical protein